MNGVIEEIKKVWHNKLFLSMTLFFLAVNFFCLNNAVNEKGYAPAAYRGLYGELKEFTGEEKQQYLQKELQQLWNQTTIEGMRKNDRIELLEDVISEVEAANGYKWYLETLKNAKDSIAGSVLFQEANAFAVKSAEKTWAEYKDVPLPKISEEPSKGIELALLTVTDILIVFAGIFICIVLFLREREQGMVRLQWTLRRGRLQHLIYKLTALFFCVGVLVLLFYGSNYLFAAKVYGFGDVSRDIRMVEYFSNVNHNISVGAWLFANVAWKILVLYLILVLCSCFCTKLQSFYGVVFCFSGLFLLEYVLYTGIAANSVFAPVRNINLFALFRVEEWLLQYHHVNVFGYPVNYRSCILVLLLVLTFLAFFFCCKGYKNYGKKLEFSKNSRKKISLFKRSRKDSGDFGKECWKVFQMQKLLYIGLGLLLLQGYFLWHPGKQIVSTEEHYYRVYMRRLEGPLNEETPKKLLEMQKEVDASWSSEAEKAFARILERYEYLKENGGDFFYDTGVCLLTGEGTESHDVILTIKMLVTILLFATAIHSYDAEHRMLFLLHSTVKGQKKVPRDKLLISLFLGILICMVVCAVDFITVMRQYPVEGLSYPAISLPHMKQFGENISIRAYLVLMYGVRVFSVCLLIPIVMTVSEKLHSFVISFGCCAIVFLCLPLLAIRNNNLKIISYPVFGVYGNELLQRGWLFIGVYLGLLLLALNFAWREREKLWN